MGGPILKDKLWFYGALRYALDTKKEVGAAENYTLKTPKYFFKMTFQASKSTRIWMFKEYDDFRRDHAGLGPLRPEEATSYEYSPMHLYNVSALHTFSDTTIMEMKIGTTTTNAEWGGYAGGYPGKDISGHYDAYTGMHSVNDASYGHSVGNRFQANSSLSHHASDFIKGSHDFKFGVEYEKLSDRSESEYNGGFYYVHNVYNSYDYKFHDYAYEYSMDREVSGDKVGFFVQDAWKITDNLTINPGIRYNVYRGHLPKLDKTPFKTSAFVPRLGITWDIQPVDSQIIPEFIHCHPVYAGAALVGTNSFQCPYKVLSSDHLLHHYGLYRFGSLRCRCHLTHRLISSTDFILGA